MKIWICTADTRPCSGGCERRDLAHVDDGRSPKHEAQQHASSRDVRHAMVHVEFLLHEGSGKFDPRTVHPRVVTFHVKRFYEASVDADKEASVPCICGKLVRLSKYGMLPRHTTPTAKGCRFGGMNFAELGKRKEDAGGPE